MIGEPLAFDALHRDLGSINIAVALRNAMIVAEVIFGQVAVQMLFTAMLIDADAAHPALEDREKALC